jgi:hypothetical protein
MGGLNTILSNEAVQALSQFGGSMKKLGGALASSYGKGGIRPSMGDLAGAAGDVAKDTWKMMNAGTGMDKAIKWGAVAGVYGTGAMGMRMAGNSLSSDPSQRNPLSASPLYNSKSQFDIAGIPFI